MNSSFWKKSSPTFTLYCLVAVILFSYSATSFGQVAELAKYSPADANSLLLMNVSKIKQSKMATSPEFRNNLEKARASGLTPLPTTSQSVMISSLIDVSTWNPNLSVAVFDLNQNVDISAIAQQYNGLMDEVGGKKSVLLPRNAYLIQLGEKSAGVISPANRQVVSRWVNNSGGSLNNLSPYLQSAVERTKVSDLVQAFDLEGAIPKLVVAGKVKSSPIFSKSSAQEVDQAIVLLQSLKGLTLEVLFSDKADARLVVDFEAQVAGSVLETQGKAILIEAMSDAGLMIDDLESWSGRADKNRYILQGTLSLNGLRHVLRLVTLPIGNFATESNSGQEKTASAKGNDEGSNTKAGVEQSQMAYVSQQYFRSVQSVFDEIDKMTKKEDMALSRYAKWFEHWADEIDALPILNVDPELLDYSQKLSTNFRQCSDAVAGVKTQATSRGAQVWNGVGEYYVWSNDAGNTRNAIRKEEMAKGVTNVRTIFRDLQADNQTIRRAMTSKYNVEF
jgi:hypothetical protein